MVGIIVSKDDVDHLDHIEISINDNIVCMIDIKLLLELFSSLSGKYENKNENKIYIPIPRKFMINNSIDQKIIHPLETDINHSYGIPFFHLIYQKVKIHITSKKPINYQYVNEIMISRYLRVKRGNAKKLYDDDRDVYDFCDDNILNKLEMQYFGEDIYNHFVVHDEYLSFGLTSYTRFRSKNHSDLDSLIVSIIIEQLKKANHISISKMCIKCFKEIIRKVKTNDISDQSYTFALYSATRIHCLDELNQLPRQLAQ